jgi:hypothetical protein
LSPGTEILDLGLSAVSLSGSCHHAVIAASDGLMQPLVLNGSLDPIGGWVSPRYGEIRAAPQLRYRLDGTTSTTAFLLQPGRGRSKAFRIQADDRRDGVVAIAVNAGETNDYLLLNENGAREASEGFGILFRGKLLWLRTQHQEPVELRVVDGESVSSGGSGSRSAPDRAHLLFTCMPGQMHCRYGAGQKT